MAEADLKPCPFCGDRMEDRGYGAIHVDGTGCPIHAYAISTEKWNRRTDPPAQAACPCTMIEQDEDCPVGYPSLICGVCKGTGNATADQVTALACEMIKIASAVGEPEDPFAAWETISLLQSQPAYAWQLIETAPKDGTDVLLSADDWHGDVTVGGWHFGAWRERADPRAPEYAPTIWHPVPATPSSKNGGQP